MKNKLNLIWCLKSKYEIDFSFNWINEIFSECDIIHHYDIENKFDKFIDNSILIVCVNDEPNHRLIDYINQYNSKNLNYVVLHLSDEAFEQNIDFYSVSKKILRNYFKKEYVEKFNIMTIPLGYQTGIKYIESPRIHDINFVGQLKSDRYEMLSKFQHINNKFFHFTRMWGDPSGLNVNQFSEVLSRSNFTLCPRGWISLDSFRINEALECNSIPISILEKDGTDYFQNVYGTHPFIIGSDWNDAYSKMISCVVETKRVEITDWWKNFKQELKIKIKQYVNE